MKYFIVTGTSHGLGQAIAEQLLSPDHFLFCISRNKNHTLLTKSNNINYLEFDLNNIDLIEDMMRNIFSTIDNSNIEGIYLINNAGVIAPLMNIELGKVEEIVNNLNVNLLAPIVLTSLFIRFTSDFDVDKRVINISSGSAKNLLPGMSAYSAAKAGLDVFTKCIGLEQEAASSSVRVVSIWPGMIETKLQEEARSQNDKFFAPANLFKMAKEQGMLTTPEQTAKKVIDLLFKEFEQGSVVDLFE